MEIIIGIAVVVALAWFFTRKKAEVAVVEAQPEPTPAAVVTAIVEGAGVVDAPAKAKAPAKKAPAKKAPAKKPAAKTAKKAPAKK